MYEELENPGIKLGEILYVMWTSHKILFDEAIKPGFDTFTNSQLMEIIITDMELAADFIRHAIGTIVLQEYEFDSDQLEIIHNMVKMCLFSNARYVEIIYESSWASISLNSSSMEVSLFQIAFFK